jgi:hypothetical protein
MSTARPPRRFHNVAASADAAVHQHFYPAIDGRDHLGSARTSGTQNQAADRRGLKRPPPPTGGLLSHSNGYRHLFGGGISHGFKNILLIARGYFASHFRMKILIAGVVFDIQDAAPNEVSGKAAREHLREPGVPATEVECHDARR